MTTLTKKVSGVYMAQPWKSIWKKISGVWTKVYHYDRLFQGDFTTNLVHELNINTLASINSGYTGQGSPYGIGGMGDRMYGSSGKTFEFNLATFATITTTTDYPNLNGVDGTTNRLYASKRGTPLEYYELNPNTLAIIRSAACTRPDGLGGMNDRLFSSAYNNGCGEINPDTFADIYTAAGAYYGIGGTSNRLYASHDYYDSSKIFELNPNTLAKIFTATATSLSVEGIGGTK